MIGFETLDLTIADRIASLTNLAAILKWIPAAGLDIKQFDIVQQDEYNYDAIFPWFDHRWLSFGVS